MSTRQFGAPVQRREDPRLVPGGGRYLDDLWGTRHTRWPLSALRTLTRESSISTRVTRGRSRAIYLHEDLPDRVGESLPLLIPHPALIAPRVGYALASASPGQPRR